MRCRAALLGLVLALGCRPGPEPGPETAGSVSVTPAGDEPEAGARTRVDATPPHASREPTPVPPSSDEGTACERICADVHACVLHQTSDLQAAAAIELGCLDACVRARPDFAACERPATITASSCEVLLDCARTAWPGDERPGTIVESPFAGDGCRAGCWALADCYGRPEAAETCAERCREVLSPDQQRMAGDCASAGDCDAIEVCMMSLPGA